MPVFALTAPPARLTVDPDRGGRIASFELHGRELLVTDAQANQVLGTRVADPMAWGCYPMVPWAGRVRRGRFTFNDGEYQLATNMAPHAIHGTGFSRPWMVQPDRSLRMDLGPGWPFGGYAIQRFALTGISLTCTLEVHNDDRTMPAMVGWHPWFKRPVGLAFAAKSMYLRDSEGIPTGETVRPPSGPWDDCFTNLAVAPRLVWPNGHALTITSSCDHWVVFDERSHAVCIEPQSGPPDGLTLEPRTAGPGQPLVATMTWAWG